MTDTAAITGLKDLIPRAWHPFLARFNTPTPVQMAGIPAIMKGLPVLLIAPTASGKTETFAAPMAEMISSDPERETLKAWIVSPTRALVNDLTRRLAPPLAAMGLRVGRRTGEHREISGSNPPHMAVTTPESLDSMLARSPSIFLQARFLVLDEVHMVDSTPRGDQLSCLVSRLRHIANDLQLVLSSATVEDPAGLASRYLGDDFKLVRISGDRPIDAVFINSGAGSLARGLRRMTMQERGIRKVLVFVQRRAEAERLFSVFKGKPPFGDSVFLHHGSLSRARRESVERKMLTGTAGLCFATSTLEVGIDIGDIDLVVLASPPPDVSALLQRIGRGSRRAPMTRLCCLSSDDGETLRYKHLLSAARKGRLLGGPYHFSPAVLVQQCLSLLVQSPNRWINAKALESRMPAWINNTGWSSRLPELLNHLAEKGWLIARSGRYYMAEKLEKAFESGLIHSNIQGGANQVQVVDRDTRQVIGSLPRVATDQGRLLLGGRRLKVSRRITSSTILVTDDAARSKLTIPGAPGPVIHPALARDLARFMGVAPNAMPVVPMGDAMALFHFMGSLWGRLLGILIRERTAVSPGRVNAFCIQLARIPDPFPRAVTSGEIRSLAMGHRQMLGMAISEGGWAEELPPSWRQAHLMECLHLDAFLLELKRAVIGEAVVPPGQHEALVRLGSFSRG